MKDRKTETDIKMMNSFLEFWGKFHSIYSGTLGKGTITKDDEDKFLETKAMMRGKYEELKGTLDYNYMPHGRLTDPVSDILLLQTIRFISEDNLKKLNNNWTDSYIFLNNIFERLKTRKRRFEEFNAMGVFFKRVREKIGKQ
ncbi:MAG: hypothetical protein PHI58_04880 [Candidatus Omnitrophica bacterium]|nr:hypothetical protein [Candidatus Omnitrophota bacterium]